MEPRRLLSVLVLLLLGASATATTIEPLKHRVAPGKEAEFGSVVSCKRTDGGWVRVKIALPATWRGTPLSGAGLVLESPAGEMLLMTGLRVIKSTVHALVKESQLPQVVITASYWNSQISKEDLVFEDLPRWLDASPR